MEEEGSLKLLGPEGVVGLGKAGGGGPLGVWGFLIASGIRSGPEGTCAPQGQSVSKSLMESKQCTKGACQHTARQRLVEFPRDQGLAVATTLGFSAWSGGGVDGTDGGVGKAGLGRGGGDGGEGSFGSEGTWGGVTCVEHGPLLQVTSGKVFSTQIRVELPSELHTLLTALGASLAADWTCRWTHMP